MSKSRFIVGLGNPGKDYQFTRHNLGFLVLQQLAEKLKLKFGLSSLTNGLMAEGKIDQHEICLLMPLTFMNNSGVAVSQIIKAKGYDFEDVLIVCDDFNLDFSQLRIRPKGSDGGHNGLSSIIRLLGTDEFARLRLGVGAPKSKNEVVDYVLEEFTKKEKDHLDEICRQAIECCCVWMNHGVHKAMDMFNRKKE